MKRGLQRTQIEESASQNVVDDRCHLRRLGQCATSKSAVAQSSSSLALSTASYSASSSSSSLSFSSSNLAEAVTRVKVAIPARTFIWSSLHWIPVTFFVVVLCGSLLPVSQQTKQKFCGKSLTEAMDLACVNGYNDKISSSAPPARKREANGFPVSQEDETKTFDLEPSFFLLNTYTLSPFVAGMYAKVMATGRRRRNGGGVYDECCRKACSYSELSAYCRSPN